MRINIKLDQPKSDVFKNLIFKEKTLVEIE